MTNIRIETSMIDDMNFCPFCGSSLSEGKNKEGNDYKRCGFHILILRPEDIDDEDRLL